MKLFCCFLPASCCSEFVKKSSPVFSRCQPLNLRTRALVTDHSCNVWHQETETGCNASSAMLNLPCWFCMPKICKENLPFEFRAHSCSCSFIRQIINQTLRNYIFMKNFVFGWGIFAVFTSSLIFKINEKNWSSRPLTPSLCSRRSVMNPSGLMRATFQLRWCLFSIWAAQVQIHSCYETIVLFGVFLNECHQAFGGVKRTPVCHNKSPSVLGEIDKVLKSHNCPSTKGWHIPDF